MVRELAPPEPGLMHQSVKLSTTPKMMPAIDRQSSKDHVKLSDFVAQFLANQGIRHVFAVSGGASLHLIHSIADTAGVEFICPQHEQAGAMAADAYARVTGNIGAAISTSGPGATNMITGICCAYYDSIPVLYITGQVATFRFKRDTGVRQMGFQETNVVEICKSITKYAVCVEEPARIRYELEKACCIARSGRPGPVLIDIPDNVQRKMINPSELASYVPPSAPESISDLLLQIRRIVELIEQAERPVIILGWGVRMSQAEEEVLELLGKLGIPILPTWAVLDLVPSDHHLLVGSFGTHGTRYGNFAVQNADLILCLGARLDTRATGSFSTFGRQARKVIVDIDPCELTKFSEFGLTVDELVQADVKQFTRQLNNAVSTAFHRKEFKSWIAWISSWKERYPICPDEYYREKALNPYVFVKALSTSSRPGEVLIVDTGCAVAWLCQAFEFKDRQRLFHDFNNTAMGYALPAAIAASLALGKGPVTCITGDGSLQMNIQELATVIRHDLPIKIFLVNNHGHSMIQQTQDQWLGSRYLASSVDGGLAFPDFLRVAAAYGFKTVNLEGNEDVSQKVEEVMDYSGPIFCNLEIDPSHRVIPQVRFGRALEDPEPFLDRREFLENMIVKPHTSSLAATPNSND